MKERNNPNNYTVGALKVIFIII